MNKDLILNLPDLRHEIVKNWIDRSKSNEAGTRNSVKEFIDRDILTYTSHLSILEDSKRKYSWIRCRARP